ncbi:MAG: recombinase family protein [Candidatus Pacearchaeota archaeon]
MDRQKIIDSVMKICDDLCPQNKQLFKRRLQQELPEDDRGKQQKQGMIEKASEGKHVSRIPFGYEWSEEKGKMVPAQNYHEIEDIFDQFLKNDAKLSHIAKRHRLSVNGLKKVLRNFAYMGKVKFDGQIHEGEHEAIIDSTTFNKVQDKLDILEKQHKKNKEDKRV